jgi:TolA-binding protein
MKHFTTILSGAIIAVLLVGCTPKTESTSNEEDIAEKKTAGSTEETSPSAEDVKKEVSEAWEAIKSYGFEKREDYQKAAESQLKELNQQIEGLQVKASALKEDMQKEIQQQLDALEEQRDAVQEKLDKIGSATEDAWQEVTAGVNKAVEDLQSAYEDAAAQFESEESSS